MKRTRNEEDVIMNPPAEAHLDAFPSEVSADVPPTELATTAPVVDGPTSAAAGDKVDTIEAWAADLGHVNVPPAKGSPIDISKQRGWIFDCVRQHFALGRGHRMTRAEYEKAVDAVHKIPTTATEVVAAPTADEPPPAA